jgi:ferredoxin
MPEATPKRASALAFENNGRANTNHGFAIPVRWSCRTGACHNCESGLVSGAVVYGPNSLDKPADGNVLVCCSQPIRDVVIDL